MTKSAIFALLTLAFAMLACSANRLQMTPATLANSKPTPALTANVVCMALRGAATVRNSDGEAVTWLPVGTPVCVVPGVNQRVILADGTNNTVLRACIFGPRKDCK